MLEDISQSRLAAYRLALEDMTPQDLVQQQARVDQSLEEVVRVDQHLSRVLHTTERLQSLRTSWQQLKARQDHPHLEQHRSQYTLILHQVRELDAHVGNTSNLILDPDLDTYYLMSVSLLTLPKVQDLQSQLHLLAQRCRPELDRGVPPPWRSRPRCGRGSLPSLACCGISCKNWRAA